jgi:hypothetical protein
MSTISISRRRERMLRYRRIEIFLDGKSLGYFPKGVLKEIDLAAGEHKLKAKMRWYRSKDFYFTLFNKERKSFVVSTNKVVFIPIVLLFIIYALSEIFTKSHELMLFVMHALAVIIAAYIFIFSRNNYLIIKEEGAD